MTTKYSGILLALLAHGAVGQTCTTLTYVGAPLTVVTVTYSGQPGDTGIPIASPIIGTITLAAPLAPNLKNATVVPASWDFSQELVGLTSTSFVCGFTEGHCSKFMFSTDAKGKIIGWNMTAFWADVDTDGAQLTFTSSSITGDTVQSYINDFEAPPSAEVGLAGNNSTPGSWLCPTQYTASNHTVPPAPVDPLAAEVATLRAQVAALTSEVNSLMAERNALENDERLLATDLTAANASLRAEDHRLGAELAAANAEIAVLRAEIAKLENK